MVPEQQIAGYREVLATLHESYEYIAPRPGIILQLHRDLYSYSSGAIGGTYKNSDNIIAETDAEGHRKTRFIPVPVFQAESVIDGKVGKITKKKIMELCPDISKVTVERTLTELVKSGYFADDRDRLHCSHAQIVCGCYLSDILPAFFAP